MDKAEYVYYQWRRLRQFLPAIVEPKFHDYGKSKNGQTGIGQWRLRISSVRFQIALNLLYSDEMVLTPEVLSLLGAEAIGSLWADRGRILSTRNAAHGTARLDVGRYSYNEAELIAGWIAALTGSHATLGRGHRQTDTPMLFFDQAATVNLMNAMAGTWFGQAQCLQAKFKIPERPEKAARKERSRAREDAAMAMLKGVDPGAASLNALLQRGPSQSV